MSSLNTNALSAKDIKEIAKTVLDTELSIYSKETTNALRRALDVLKVSDANVQHARNHIAYCAELNNQAHREIDVLVNSQILKAIITG